jgi:hypothetical protein
LGWGGAGNPIYKSGRKATGKPFKKQGGRATESILRAKNGILSLGWEAIADFFKVSEGKMREKKKKLLEAGVIFYIRWGRPLSMPLFGLQGAKLCFPLSLFWLSPLDLPLQSGYYPSEIVAYPKYRQDLTHRGVLRPLENEPPFPKKRGGVFLMTSP